jgi:hypothetical protein
MGIIFIAILCIPINTLLLHWSIPTDLLNIKYSYLNEFFGINVISQKSAIC